VTVLTIGVLVGLIVAVVPAAECLVKHLDDHHAVAFVEEGE
jgi:hypothetical protein